MKILDSEGTDIWPLVKRYATENGIPPVLLLACGQAESNWRRTAERWGVYPDISFGAMQISVPTAAGYGIGDGTEASAPLVRAALFDLETSIRLGARHLAWCWQWAGEYDLTRWPDLSRELAALCIYNGGHLYPPDSGWWQRWAGNVQRYRECLAWAREQLA